jgi:hypothetical protein
MNIKEIEALVEKFYEGSTSLSEERQLREFFSGADIPPHLAVHAELFRYYESSGKEELTDTEFETRFLKSIEETSVIPLNNKRKQVYFITGIAASILLLTGIFFTFRNDIFLHSPKETLQQEIAYQKAEKALLLLSSNFNTGLDKTQSLASFQTGLNEIQRLNTFQKGIDQMNKLSEFYQYQQIIINPDDKNRP